MRRPRPELGCYATDQKKKKLSQAYGCTIFKLAMSMKLGLYVRTLKTVSQKGLRFVITVSH